MSISGIRSNRGDGYQTLVAFDWALTVLVEQNHSWLEIDSIAYSVDDVVVGKANGSLIACQCKKNQIEFKAWTITDLSDELEKAARLLTENSQAEVRFYSRSNFGALAKLREHSSTQHDETSYRRSLTKDHKKTDAALTACLSTHAPSLSTYEFLVRTKFVTTDELDRMADLLRERLRNIVSNSDAAFDSLWVCLDQLGARMGCDSASAATQSHLTKDDLKVILNKAGAMLTPPMNLAEVRSSFLATSAIGRTWRRDIAGARISNLIVRDLLVAIHEKKKAILLTGLPGAGKTCVMLELQEALEQQAQTCTDIVPLFIQSREYADFATSQDRQAQGLSERWVEKVARLAESAHVIVIIDSLDVLSIAREHSVLNYFLAQIDRLLLLQNITVVTACRDFDRHYDRRIAERQWDCELKCMPLDWVTEIIPLLDTLGIASTNIDAVTRELIKNPRELALFVELAKREGNLNVVTSQSLAQRYLDVMVRANSLLGVAAIQAIENIASDMLKTRSLMVPHQRFTGSHEILRALCSLNVLQENHDGKLTFGHQTLLDVLVISGALRSGVTLNEFIHRLSPVPFVRPSIRSFTEQLVLRDRREFRTQVRTVLTGCSAFHIRRLVAESFALQKPVDEDWPLIRDLRERHRDVFQVIYTSASAIEWHRFWLRYLVPMLKTLQDSEGLLGHVHRIARWNNEDAIGVLSFWSDALSLDWLNCNDVADRLDIYLSDIKLEHIGLVVPLLTRLLDIPRSEHNSLGRVIARCVDAGVVDDDVLWRFIEGGIGDEDLIEYRFDNKLRCQGHEFGDRHDNFLPQRIEKSTVLLDLALDSIERWSNARVLRYGETRIGYRQGFLRDTSYDDVHSEGDRRHVDSMNVLLDAVEAAVLRHAYTNSDWWQYNRDRLCFNHEGSLLYFAILACTKNPEDNIDQIGRMLCDQNMLEFDLTYELGTMVQSAFRFLAPPTQDAVMETILSTWNDETVNGSDYFWILKTRAELIIPIPCYQRSPAAQALVDLYKKKVGVLIRQPDIHSHSGIVRAPFSFVVFLQASNGGVLSLLEHYKDQSDCHGSGVDFLIGGSREVAWQLREASSCHPIRFLSLLSANWMNIPERFRDGIIDGVATHLAYRYGNRQFNETWLPVEKPNAQVLVSQILDMLERRPSYWRHRKSAAKALEACANVIKDRQHAERLIFLAIGFSGLFEEDPITGNDLDLLSLGINMAKGDVAESLMILAENFIKQDEIFPELLAPTLRRFASDEHPAVRSLILRRLPYLQSKMFEFGWRLFHLVMQDANGLWQIAEPSIYYAYRNHFEIVGPLLNRLYREGFGKDLETWGRISALAAMEQCIDFTQLLQELKTLNSSEAWLGATTVWTHSKNIQMSREQCLAGIRAGLNTRADCAEVVVGQMDEIFRETTVLIEIPLDIIRRCFSVFESDSKNKHHRLHGFHEWLNATSQHDPEHALSVTEIYLAYARNSKPHLYDHENKLTQLITRLFSEAEEREESDSGSMLQRVVVVQDTLLSLGVNSVFDWLKAAERP